MQALWNHQAENQKNIAAENNHVRKSVWGDDGTKSEPDEMPGNIYLGDYTPAPVVVQQPQPSGAGKIIAGAAIALAAMGIPGAAIGGYLLSKALEKPAAATTINNVEDQTNISLKRLKDLIPQDEQVQE